MDFKIPGYILLRSSIILTVCYSLSLASSSFGPPVSVKVGDPALLACSSPCHGEVKWTLSKHKKQLLVTECGQETCAEGDAFQNRTKTIQDNCSLLLDPAVFTDNGWYMSYCNGSLLCEIHLDVFEPIIIRAEVGDTVTLPCYTHTEKDAAETDVNMRWERDGQLVVEIEKGRISYGSGFEQRALVSVSGYKDGDLSVTIRNFSRSDEGLYRCYHKNKDLGYLKAVILTASSSRVEKTQCRSWMSSLVSIAVPVVVLFICCGFLGLAMMKNNTDINSDIIINNYKTPA